jgi:hypothetical protein
VPCANVNRTPPQDVQALNSQLDTAQSYVDSRRAQMAGGAHGQQASHSTNVVGQLKAELLSTTKTFKVRHYHNYNGLTAKSEAAAQHYHCEARQCSN